MTTLTAKIDTLTRQVLGGSQSLDEALQELETWLNNPLNQVTGNERRTFSEALHEPTSNDNRSLVNSTLKLHATRLMHRHESAGPASAPAENTTGGDKASDYTTRRAIFEQALQDASAGINESRIDIAIASAHNLLGDIAANRRWLSLVLDRLPELAATDLAALAEAIPPMPPPRLNPLRRVALILLGANLDKMAERSRANLAVIAHMQTNQIIILAHLTGVSLDAANQRARAQRAFRVAAHLITRNKGMPGEDIDHLLEIADSLAPVEPEAAQMLARQALDQGDREGCPPETLTRIKAMLDPQEK